VVRHLFGGGWHVRALTRDPDSRKARPLVDLGVELVRVDMADRASLEPAFDGVVGVYSVQNPFISGLEQEVVQGKNVADVAQAAGVRHLVYASAGVGSPTGIGSWDSKLAVEEHIAKLGVPATILRPQAFMELMTDRAFYPPVAAWHVMPKLLGPERKVPWLAVDDLGGIGAKAFADPERFVGRTITLAADAQSIDECRAIWREVRGRPPRRFPMPVQLFERVAGTDLTTMWRWSRSGPVPLDASPTREILPHALTVREWLARHTDERRNDGR
jgi:uncharacterized protein YbjT (DUF2867 family)